jgi:hypothetical protein
VTDICGNVAARNRDVAVTIRASDPLDVPENESAERVGVQTDDQGARSLHMASCVRNALN